MIGSSQNYWDVFDFHKLDEHDVHFSMTFMTQTKIHQFCAVPYYPPELNMFLA